MLEQSEYKEYRGCNLEELIQTLPNSKLKNCAGQHFNHSFYWKCMNAPKSKQVYPQLLQQINNQFDGGLDELKKQFTAAAAGHFGSGWAWLLYNKDSEKLVVTQSHDAAVPTAKEGVPILVCDVWEHAYYIDYQNNRGAYIQHWWE